MIRRRMLLPALAVGTAFSCSTGARAQNDWRRMQLPAQRSSAAFAVDPGTGVGVLHGGRTYPLWPQMGSYCDDEWIWDAGRWRQPTGPRPALPPWGEGQQLLVDGLRNRLLLVGGVRTAGWPSGEEYSIWQHRQGVWSELVHTAAPGPLPSTTAYAYDELRDRIVAFSASMPFTGTAETWEWDWSRWIRATQAVSPPARFGGALGYDRARQRTVLFGGAAPPATLFNDTWEWDGTSWQQIVAAPSPQARTWARFAYDPVRARLLLVGGDDARFAATRFADLWSYDASGWTLLSTGGVPARSGAAVTFDGLRQRLLMLGGTEGMAPTGDLWEWDGTRWRQAAPAPVPSGGTLITDWARGRVLAVRGDGFVCERLGAGWVATSGANALPPRSFASVGHDPLRARTILFGGMDLQLRGDTWIWDGAAWSQAQPAASPSPRSSAGMTTDVGGGVLLFGGNTVQGVSNETWRWNGTTWTQLNPATVPGAREHPLLATDLQRGVVVMLGGSSPVAGILRDTWEWNGSQWQERVNAYGPLLSNAAMTYDPARQVVSVCGVMVTTGFPPRAPYVEVHDWDGVAWNRVTIPDAGQGGSESYAFDPAVGRCVRVDGQTPYGGTFEFGRVQALATSMWSGFACAYSGFDLSGEGLYLGESAWLRLGPPPTSARVPVFLCLGTSNRSWGSTQLPLDLSAFGLTGCRLYVAPDVVVHVGDGGNGLAPSLRLAAPLDPRFAGLDIHMQAIALVPGINAAGLSLSDAETLRLGLR